MRMSRNSIDPRFSAITEGMPVYSQDSEKLGKITMLSDDYFVIEKGLFFPKDFTLRYDDIQDLRDGSLYVNLAHTDLSDWRNESYAGWNQAHEINTGGLNAQPRDEFKDRYSNWSNESVNVPVVEEELQATKTMRQSGNVQVRKVVHTELRHFTIPVMREELRVERVAVTDRDTSARTDASTFEEKTINVPLMEEEVTISKKPVVKEEVRVSKERMTEERQVEGEIRKEEVRIEGDTDLDRRKKIA